MRSRISGLDDDSGRELPLIGKIPLEYIAPFGILLDELGVTGRDGCPRVGRFFSD
jgi:hypothetical protein